jgi:hypothetical protein
VVFGIAESEAEDADTRKLHDATQVGEIIQTLDMEQMKKLKTFRLGKKGDGQAKPRPLKLVLEDEKTKNEFLGRARELRKTKYKDIFVVQDMTLRERECRRQLLKARDAMKLEGKDMIIVQGKLVPKRN